MAQEIIIKNKCSACGGDGLIPNYSSGVIDGSSNCEWPGCVDGYIEVGKFTINPGLDDILDKCNDIFEKVSE